MKRPARSVALALLLAGPVTATPAAWAAPSEDPRVVEARRACAAGQVDRGMDLLASVIADTGDPGAVYNQARCFQQNGRPEDAIIRFREYLRVGHKEPLADRRTAERFIKELEAEIAEKEKRAPVVTPVPSTSEPPSPATPSENTSAPLVTPDPGTSSTPPLRWAAYGAGAVGVLGLGFGVFNSLRVRSIQSDLNEGPPKSGLEYDRLKERGYEAENRQYIGYGVGAAALAGGALLYWLSRPETGTQVSLTLPFGPGAGAGLRLSGRY
ncbi:MAG TPA: hypothetical protein VGG33_19680 [Polyangia bacterium]